MESYPTHMCEQSLIHYESKMNNEMYQIAFSPKMGQRCRRMWAYNVMYCTYESSQKLQSPESIKQGRKEDAYHQGRERGIVSLHHFFLLLR